MSEPGTGVVVYGAGAIGVTVGGWLAEAGVPVTYVARPATARLLNEQGLRLYAHGHKAEERRIPVVAVTDMTEAATPDMVVLAVKNYDLDAAASDIRAKLRSDPIVIALQNGVVNQEILPAHFTRVVYGVIGYNAWRDAGNEVGYGKKGPILLGVTDQAMVPDRDRAVQLFASAFECRAEQRIADAARCKMLFNLMTSLMALVGFGVRELEDYGAFARCVTHVLYEGMQLLSKAGIHEVRIDRGGGWGTIKTLRILPVFITSRILKRVLGNFHLTSMAQDVYLTRRSSTELDSLNGYFVRLADSIGFDAPYNRTLYLVMQEWLGRADIRPMHERELWQKLRAARPSS